MLGGCRGVHGPHPASAGMTVPPDPSPGPQPLPRPSSRPILWVRGSAERPPPGVSSLALWHVPCSPPNYNLLPDPRVLAGGLCFGLLPHQELDPPDGVAHTPTSSPVLETLVSQFGMPGADPCVGSKLFSEGPQSLHASPGLQHQRTRAYLGLSLHGCD